MPKSPRIRPRAAVPTCLAVMVALTLAAAAPAAASVVRLIQPPGATGKPGNAAFFLIARPGEANDVKVEFADGKVSVRDSAGLAIAPNGQVDSASCRYSSGDHKSVSCVYSKLEGARVAQGRIALGDRNDRLRVSGVAAFTPRLVIGPGVGNDLVIGGPRVDAIADAGGTDFIAGGAGGDVIFAGPGNDRVAGGSGNDVIRGGPGFDVIFGESGADRIAGNAGNDFLTGGPGLDVVVGGLGFDVINGRGGEFSRG